MPWKPGDKPEAHPLWEEQVALELEMLQKGAEKYRESVAKARGLVARTPDGKPHDPQMTRLRPYRRVMEAMVADMAKGVEAWLRGYKKRQGAVPQAYHRIRGMNPALLAYVTVRTVMDSMTVQKLGLHGIALQIGIACDYEDRMQRWIEKEPALFKEIQSKLRNQKATDSHRKRVNINRFNVLVKDKIKHADWSHDDRRAVGLALVDIMVRTTGHFTVSEEPYRHHGKGYAPTGRERSRYVILPSDELLQHLADALEDEETRAPHYLPTIMPPKRWEGIRRGGYYTQFLPVPKLIRFRADNEEVQGIAADEYDALDMPRVFSALHRIQETPWRINQRVLAVANEIWERDLGLADLARREPDPLPPRPVDMDTNSDAAKSWKRAAAKVYGENARRVSSGTAVRTTLQIANRFRTREFYFPHMLDFRGRMYPIPAYLQPQGSDLARGLLTFAQGRPVTLEDAGWLAIHLANCWGEDKVSFDDRITWVEERREMWLRITKDPLHNREWCAPGRDDPWQTLAAIFEWARFLEEGEGMVSALPIRVDGTCNGIQHLSAMMRDEVGGQSVNLYPSEYPRDIYEEVAAILKEILESIRDGGGEEGRKADLWLNAGFDRNLTKKPVMVTPYGGTKDSYFGAIHKWLDKYDPEGRLIPNEERREAIPFLVTHLWNAVGARTKAARACMGWLKGCADILSETGQPISWTTASGFHVRHFYGAIHERQIKTQIDGRTIQLVDYKRTKKLSRREQLQGIAPNFVHSQDGAVNMETIIAFAMTDPLDPPPFTSIHDAFGSVAACMWKLYHCIRGAFIQVHQHDVLNDFRQRCVMMYRDHLMATCQGMDITEAWEIAEDKIKFPPKRGELRLEEVRNADYFFA